MTQQHIKDLVRIQREYFDNGKTRDVNFRLAQLKKLQEGLRRYEARFAHAVKQDLEKSPEETFTSEIAPALGEIKNAISKLSGWARRKRVRTPLIQFKARSYIQYEPLGAALIIAPWNYPVAITISRLVSAVAAGNTVILKPSGLTPLVNEVMEKLISQYFDRGHVALLMPQDGVNEVLMEQHFDVIHFTGSTAVGKQIYENAAATLTPVVLELGGKSPAIVHKDADLALAARRLIWGKSLNAGQTCVAPDYLLVHEDIKDQLLRHMREEIRTMFGPVVRNSPYYGRIISPRHFERLAAMLDDGEVLIGGETDRDARFIAPTVLANVEPSAPCMQEEIFGPILPLFTYSTLDEAVATINSHPAPLSIYCFATNLERASIVEKKTVSGAVVFNDVLTHAANPNLPFGGTGQSGIGRSNGFAGFASMSNQRAVAEGSNMFDLPMRFAPWSSWKIKVMRWFLG